MPEHVVKFSHLNFSFDNGGLAPGVFHLQVEVVLSLGEKERLDEDDVSLADHLGAIDVHDFNHVAVLSESSTERVRKLIHRILFYCSSKLYLNDKG